MSQTAAKEQLSAEQLAKHVADFRHGSDAERAAGFAAITAAVQRGQRVDVNILVEMARYAQRAVQQAPAEGGQPEDAVADRAADNQVSVELPPGLMNVACISVQRVLEAAANAGRSEHTEQDATAISLLAVVLRATPEVIDRLDRRALSLAVLRYLLQAASSVLAAGLVALEPFLSALYVLLFGKGGLGDSKVQRVLKDAMQGSGPACDMAWVINTQLLSRLNSDLGPDPEGEAEAARYLSQVLAAYKVGAAGSLPAHPPVVPAAPTTGAGTAAGGWAGARGDADATRRRLQQRLLQRRQASGQQAAPQVPTSADATAEEAAAAAAAALLAEEEQQTAQAAASAAKRRAKKERQRVQRAQRAQQREPSQPGPSSTPAAAGGAAQMGAEAGSGEVGSMAAAAGDMSAAGAQAASSSSIAAVVAAAGGSGSCGVGASASGSGQPPVQRRRRIRNRQGRQAAASQNEQQQLGGADTPSESDQLELMLRTLGVVDSAASFDAPVPEMAAPAARSASAGISAAAGRAGAGAMPMAAMQAEAAAAAAPQPTCAAAAAATTSAAAPVANGMDPSLLLPDLECPITQEVMEDPVVAADGNTYERAAIEAWITRQQAAGQAPCSPMTNLPLASLQLTPNLATRRWISRLRDAGKIS